MLFLFAINPASGGKGKNDWEVAIHNFFANNTHSTELFHLDGKTDDTELPRKIREVNPDCVVAVGGDGTIKSVAEHLVDTGVPLGVLPAGSANGMARELNIPQDIDGSLNLLVDGQNRPVDCIDVNGELCIHLSDVGLNAQLVRYYQRNNLRGKLGYLRSVMQVLKKRRLLRVEINLDDQCVQRAAFMIVLANARMYGTGAVINPDGDPSDGKFEIVVFRRLTVWEIVKLFWRYQPFDSKNIEIFPATSIKIATHRKAYFQVDGEYQGRVTEIDAKIRPGALMMRLPA
ncbi:diacylglycerol/lipid kinase family protein [Spirosoma rhododendri]|uniref:Diacylglycerol kinase family lipid kinase n=1 Tax=Spirosoma rhododendri TaxID=2728024 RepID=A0A7L5DIA1_9BACT|nr:diacylglycerol kinase family protein [Spirosoma rhododendri]QJD77112.1 diacylglycerol kinase family lipid kinase [Spirosoma rhododendri]